MSVKRKRNNDKKSDIQDSPTVHQNFFLKREQMEVAESIFPGSLERTLNAFDKQQEHDHLIDRKLVELHDCNQKQESSDSWKAFTIILFFGGGLAAFLFMGKTAEASIFGGFFTVLALLARAVRKNAEPQR